MPSPAAYVPTLGDSPIFSFLRGDDRPEAVVVRRWFDGTSSGGFYAFMVEGSEIKMVFSGKHPSRIPATWWLEMYGCVAGKRLWEVAREGQPVVAVTAIGDHRAS